MSQQLNTSLRSAAALYKQKSWSPDIYREEVWRKRKAEKKERRRSKSVTDEDVEELKGCIELGFGFDSPEMDRCLSDTLPALGLYYAVNKHYQQHTTTLSNSSSSSSSSFSSEPDIPSPLGSPLTIFSPGDNPQRVKTRLRQWAQVVACSVRQSSSG